MRRILLAAAFGLAALCAPTAHAQFSTTPYSQTNGNVVPLPGSPSQCTFGATGIDANGNAVCATQSTFVATGQTAALTNQVVCPLATCVAGLYQLTLYMVPTTTATIGTLGAQLSFTDEGQAQTVSMITGLSLLSKTPGQATYTFYTTGAADIKVSTLFANLTGSPAYSIRAAVRRVG